MRSRRRGKDVSDRFESLGETVVDVVDDVKHRLSDVGDKIGGTAKDVMSAASDTLDAAKDTVDNAKQRVEDAKGKVEDAKEKVDDAKGKLEDAKERLEDARGKLHAFRRKGEHLAAGAQDQAHDKAVTLRDNRRKILPVLLTGVVSIAAFVVQMRMRQRSK